MTIIHILESQDIFVLSSATVYCWIVGIPTATLAMIATFTSITTDMEVTIAALSLKRFR